MLHFSFLNSLVHTISSKQHILSNSTGLNLLHYSSQMPPPPASFPRLLQWNRIYYTFKEPWHLSVLCHHLQRVLTILPTHWQLLKGRLHVLCIFLSCMPQCPWTQISIWKNYFGCFGAPYEQYSFSNLE